MSFLKLIYYGLLALCLITLLINRKKINSIYYWFIPLIGFGVITQVIGDIVNYSLAAENKQTFMFHFYQPIEYMLLALFYWRLLEGKIVKKIVLISIPLFISFCIYYYSTNIKSYLGPDFTNFTLEAILITGLVAIFFLQLFKSEEYLNLTTYPAFWINTGNLFFYGGNLFVMGLHYYLAKQDSKLAEEFLSINHYLNLLLYMLYIIAFVCSKTNRK